MVKYIHSHTNGPAIFRRHLYVLAQLPQNESRGLWDITGSEGYIYAAFKNESDEGISGDRK